MAYSQRYGCDVWKRNPLIDPWRRRRRIIQLVGVAWCMSDDSKLLQARRHFSSATSYSRRQISSQEDDS
jgi:hypothetical protein